jgi:hypothetical protein
VILKIGFTLWVAVWVPFYGSWYGPQNFLWFCDIGNFIIAAALWTESRRLFSWQAVSVLAIQLLYTVDLAVALVTGFHPIGGSEYMFVEATPLHVRLLSLFHVATPMILIWGLRRYGYDGRAFWMQSIAAWIVLPIGYLFGPDQNLNWVWGPFDRPQRVVPPLVYLGACLVLYPALIYFPSHWALSKLFVRKEKA